MTIIGRWMWGFALLTFVWSLLIYSSPSPLDHRNGGLIMLWAGVMVATLFLGDSDKVRYVQAAVVAPLFLALGYCALKYPLHH